MKELSSHKKPFLVSFSGIDGAGKSTQISRLTEALQATGSQVRIITFWDDVVALKSLREDVGHKVFKGDKGVGSPDAPISRRDKNVQSPLLSVFRMGLYFLDALSLRNTIKKCCRDHRPGVSEVIIFDRFLYDELANLRLGSRLHRFYARLVLRLVPKPDVAFVLDADPDAAFKRKPEYPLEFLHANRNAYLNMARLAGMSVISPSTIDLAHAEIVRQVREKQRALPPGGRVAGQVFEQEEFAS